MERCMDGAVPNGKRRACRIIPVVRMSVSHCRKARMQFASFGCEMHWRCVPVCRGGGIGGAIPHGRTASRSICIGVAALTFLIGAAGSGFFQMHDALAMRINGPR
eukprot:9487010-Pyramimonas_sp.AAC.1